MYRWNPEDYHQHSPEQQRWALELLAKLDLEGYEKVLDIGCGDGKVTAEIAGHVPRGSVLGIDSSPQMIKFARKEFPREQYQNLAFEVVDAIALNFDCEFDVVFSNATLHWVKDHLTVLQGISRSLRPSGRILLQMGGRGNAAKIIEALNQVIDDRRWGSYFGGFSFPYGFYGPEEYTVWLEKAGITPKRVELVCKDMIHRGKEGLAGWVRTTWLPYTTRLPEELRREFIEAIAQTYMDTHPADSDGYVHLRMVRLEVEGVKILA